MNTYPSNNYQLPAPYDLPDNELNERQWAIKLSCLYLREKYNTPLQPDEIEKAIEDAIFDYYWVEYKGVRKYAQEIERTISDLNKVIPKFNENLEKLQSIIQYMPHGGKAYPNREEFLKDIESIKIILKKFENLATHRQRCLDNLREREQKTGLPVFDKTKWGGNPNEWAFNRLIHDLSQIIRYRDSCKINWVGICAILIDECEKWDDVCSLKNASLKERFLFPALLTRHDEIMDGGKPYYDLDQWKGIIETLRKRKKRWEQLYWKSIKEEYTSQFLMKLKRDAELFDGAPFF